MSEIDLEASFVRWNALLEKPLFSGPHIQTAISTNSLSRPSSVYYVRIGDAAPFEQRFVIE
jgi:hypothetical protein